MRVLALLWATVALSLPLAAPGGQSQSPVQLVLHSKPDSVGPFVIEHISDSHSRVPSPPLPSHVQPPPPPSPPPHRLPPELRLPTKQRLPPGYAELDRPERKLERSDNTTEPDADADDTDVSLCITLAALAALAGDAHEQGEVRLCMGADTSPARRVYTRFIKWAAQHPAYSHPVDLARAWASVVQQAFIDML
ncbi:hypothetical protein CcaverHIS002_0309770 [Cutaneotrichosporon cavernicola]|uniref:Uncharacterized protein n=1 Tax=Cutaneotrichosporon cavernicola TaxID=279322 RepID=A0AA48L182_9TREE|nr:uncharacterized protein CcaverHIS019_0309610 [Cutaneotrichosporon cavernicola]BEI83109.1 hypothetical protein CcaverHIS002_0309770 [Cutaneotrichosporon cavernicola]BEI90891.1 hypothetical protein CcaverHIS019_0309610 [Cutaneotrichosporon cavernicola]BEI98670.1 hypothetical protein CcaverHIS631_0309690 [Cutaneotrichosporon cavernicola]BEJ06440.1 hypothetical protein CcaverHIS641_0309620 [Cutaneotrichosporon cavernicola]